MLILQSVGTTAPGDRITCVPAIYWRRQVPEVPNVMYTAIYRQSVVLEPSGLVYGIPPSSCLSGMFYLLSVSAECYCCALSQSVKHTHTLGRTPLDNGLTRRRDLYLTTQNMRQRDSTLQSRKTSGRRSTHQTACHRDPYCAV
jgi:hypothetical protein